MPEHIRALIVVLVVSSLVWWLARPAVVQVIAPKTFSRWRTLWYITTLAWFLGQSFWIYVVLMGVVYAVAARREPYVLGLYLVALIAAPPSGAAIPGFGVMDHLFMLNHYRLLALVMLLPCAWHLANRSSTVGIFRSPVDWMVVGYLLLNSALAFREDSFTNGAREAVMLWIDFYLPYYVASRSIQDEEGFRHAFAGLMLSGVLLGTIAAVEVWRNWKLYEGAAAALGLNTFGAYKTRGNFIRPSVTVQDSIVLGYVVVMAAGSYLYLQQMIKGRVLRLMGWFALMIGVLGSLSRGPWVGSALLIFIFTLTSARPFKRLIQTGVLGAFAMLGLAVSPFGDEFINLLPFVGGEEQGNVDYRVDLLGVSLPVIERNPWFGDLNYIHAPELEVMRQGEGIIDIVNSYLGATLHAGVVGLFFFAGIFLTSLLALRRGMRFARRQEDAPKVLIGRCLFAMVVSTMFIIFTVSSISVLPTIYFTLAGLASAYLLSQYVSAKTQTRGASA